MVSSAEEERPPEPKAETAKSNKLSKTNAEANVKTMTRGYIRVSVAYLFANWEKGYEDGGIRTKTRKRSSKT